MNLLENLERLATEASTGIDFGLTATQLERVDTLEIARSHDNIVIKAEYSCGKTFSLNPIADKVLYVAHRVSLIQQNSHFAKAVTINKLPYINTEDYEYIVLDEVLGCMAGFSWKEVDFSQVINQLRKFEGKIIALDRDASPRINELLSKICGREFVFYHHKTTSRNKAVLFTRSLKDIFGVAD